MPRPPRPPRTPPEPPPATPDPVGAAVGRRPLLAAAILAAMPFVVAFVGYTPRYQTNDDATMNLIAAGLAFADRPDEHLLYTNVLIGLPLKWLYEHAPTFPWYGCYQFVTLYAAATGLGYALLRVNPSWRQALVVFVFMWVAVFQCAVEVQFTKTSSITCLAGLLLFLAPLRGAEPWPRAAVVAAAALVLWGSLVRFDSLLLACVITAPVALAAAWPAPARALRAAWPLAATVAVALGLHAVNQLYYAAEDGWKDFYAYNAMRAEFTDYNRYRYTRDTQPAYEAAGWKPIDEQMLKVWFYADPEVYSLERMRRITETVPLAERRPLPQTFVVVAEQLVKYPDLAQVLMAFGCAVLLTGFHWRRLILPSVLFALAFALAMFFDRYYYIPNHVLILLFFGAMAGAVLRPQGPDILPSVASWILAGAVVLTFLVVVLLTFVTLGNAEIHRQKMSSDVQRWVTELDTRPDQLFVVWADIFPFERLVDPLHDPKLIRPFRCVSLSFLLPTPFTKRRMAEFDVTNLYQAICERSDVFVGAQKDRIPLLRQYLFVHYGIDVPFHMTFRRGPPPFEIYQADTIQPRLAPSSSGRNNAADNAGVPPRPKSEAGDGSPAPGPR